MKLFKRSRVRYWFVSFQFANKNRMGFGNICVKTKDLLIPPMVQKYIADDMKLDVVMILSFHQITAAEFDKTMDTDLMKIANGGAI